MGLSQTVEWMNGFRGTVFLLISEAPGSRTEPGTKKKAGSTNCLALEIRQLVLKQLTYSRQKSNWYKLVWIPVPEGLLCAWHCSRHFTHFLNSPGSERWMTSLLKWVSKGSERLSHVPKITKPKYNRAAIKPKLLELTLFPLGKAKGEGKAPKYMGNVIYLKSHAFGGGRRWELLVDRA